MKTRKSEKEQTLEQAIAVLKRWQGFEKDLVELSRWLGLENGMREVRVLQHPESGALIVADSATRTVRLVKKPRKK